MFIANVIKDQMLKFRNVYQIINTRFLYNYHNNFKYPGKINVILISSFLKCFSTFYHPVHPPADVYWTAFPLKLSNGPTQMPDAGGGSSLIIRRNT